MAGETIVQWWTDWGIQIVVVFSFSFQVFIFLFAGKRRRNDSAVLNLLLWLVYQLADPTAIYALGHLSVTRSSPKHQLVAFWAPLLLVHLGGPDSITAYAIEDSRLWLRHLLTLFVQTLGAFYVFLNYVTSASSGRMLEAASVLMLIVGVLKYVERTWALICGSMDGIKSRLFLIDDTDDSSLMAERLKKNLLIRKNDNEEELLIIAHFLLRRCMRAFAGQNVWLWRNTSDVYGLQGNDVYKLVQMQLSLMYDIMYTKAWVIHTLYGYCIRAVSLVAMITSLLLFLFSNRNGYSRVDVGITYFLLGGAVVLDIISVFTTIGSTWMCAWLFSFERTHMLVKVLTFLRRRVGAASKRTWPISIGQYNLLHFCTRDKSQLGSKATKKMGLEKWWTSVHFVCTAHISETTLRSLLLETLPKLDPENSRGIQMLERNGLDKEQAEWSHWSLTLDFGKSILIWHLATDFYLIRSKNGHGRQGDQAKAVKILSNYMMFLLVTKPDMLPSYIEETRHYYTSLRLDDKWSRHPGNTESPQKCWDMLKKQLHNDGPNGSRIPQLEKLALTFHSEFLSANEGQWEYVLPENKKPAGSTTPYNGAEVHATELAAELLHLESRKSDMLEIVFGVWMEMLVYAAMHCGPESHASQLSRGGEFITVVWLLIGHFNLSLRQYDQY